MSMIKQQRVFLSARRYDFFNDNHEEVTGVKVGMLDCEVDSDDANLVGGLVEFSSLPIDEWGAFRDLEALTTVEATYSINGTRLKLVSIKPVVSGDTGSAALGKAISEMEEE